MDKLSGLISVAKIMSLKKEALHLRSCVRSAGTKEVAKCSQLCAFLNLRQYKVLELFERNSAAVSWQDFINS